MMQWRNLLSARRLGRAEPPSPQPGRSEFQRDFDRIVFSSAFRRLQDKTQVFPLAQTDYVRTRLTHSLEASCVGRSLGTLVGASVLARHPELREQHISEAEFGAIVAAACLGHDIGNPPFGHTGESAIQDWFRFDPRGRQRLEKLPPQQRADLERFEGNAQGFRILSHLQGDRNAGGMQLTCATLAAFTKYPRAAHLPGERHKKHGFTADDQPRFAEVAAATGLPALGDGEWVRHPLAYLVEAADDICYNIIDAEDGYYARYIGFDALFEPMARLVGDGRRARAAAMGEQEAIEYLRANLIGVAVNQVAERFTQLEPQLLAGEPVGELVADVPAGEVLAELKALAKAKSYNSPPVVQVEAAGFNVLAELIDRLLSAVEDTGPARRGRSRIYEALLPDGLVPEGASPYQRILAITDFVSGLTDSSAVTLYQRLMGISLPA